MSHEGETYWEPQVTERSPEIPTHTEDHILNKAEAILKQTFLQFGKEWRRPTDGKRGKISDSRGTYGYYGVAWPTESKFVLRARLEPYGTKDSTELETLQFCRGLGAKLLLYLNSSAKIYVFNLSDIEKSMQSTTRFGKPMKDFDISLGTNLLKYLEEGLGWQRI